MVGRQFHRPSRRYEELLQIAVGIGGTAANNNLPIIGVHTAVGIHRNTQRRTRADHFVVAEFGNVEIVGTAIVGSLINTERIGVPPVWIVARFGLNQSRPKSMRSPTSTIPAGLVAAAKASCGSATPAPPILLALMP